MIKSILYVEDDENTREEVAFFLETLTQNLYVAQDGKEGLELYKKHLPQITISDIMMPNMDGFDMSENILKLNKNANIVLLTAYNDVENFRRAIHIGIKEYLGKPVDFEELAKKVKYLEEKILIEEENKKNNQLLQEYKEAVDKSTVFVKLNKEGKFIYVNDEFYKLTELLEGEVIGKTLEEIGLNTSTSTDILEKIKELKTWNGNFKISNKNHTKISFSGNFYPLKTTDNDLDEIIGLLYNITELNTYKDFIETKLYKTSKNLQEKKKHILEYNKILDEGIAMCHVDIYGFIQKTNEAFNEIFDDANGYTSIVFTELLNFKDGYFDILLDVLQENNIFKQTVQLPFGKQHKTINLTYIGMHSLDDNLEEVVVLVTDISDALTKQEKFYKMQTNFLYTLSEIIERHSGENGLHATRVCKYSELLAQKANFSKDETDQIKLATTVHDIGMLGVPKEIIDKRSCLTANEHLIIQRHAQLGHDILSRSSEPLMQIAAAIALEHHERWDGNGYPRGLSKNQISIYGRIVAIADAFDALTNSRPYKSSWDIKVVYKYFEINSGIQFDPELIKIFLSSKEEIENIRKKYT